MFMYPDLVLDLFKVLSTFNRRLKRVSTLDPVICGLQAAHYYCSTTVTRLQDRSMCSVYPELKSEHDYLSSVKSRHLFVDGNDRICMTMANWLRKKLMAEQFDDGWMRRKVRKMRDYTEEIRDEEYWRN